MKKINNKHIDSKIDWFISSLLTSYKQYKLDESAKSQLIFFIYLLLNPEFQAFLIRLRTLLSIPENGFVEVSEFRVWQTAFNQSAYNFKTENPIDEKFIKVLQFLELKMGRLIRPIKSNATAEDPDEELLHVLVKELRIDRPFYFQWLLFLKSVLFLPDPKQFLDNLAHQAQEEKVLFDPYKITIMLTRKSTLNSIKATLDKNKTDIRKTIQGVKTRTKETALEVHNLDRDYLAYKIYTGYKSTRKRGDDSVFNVPKGNYVQGIAQELDDDLGLGKIDDVSIGKIVNRMNTRISNIFSDKRSIFNAVIDEIEQAFSNL